MARVFAGNPDSADGEVLARLRRLPDDFWVLAEVNIERNVDIVIAKPGDTGPATLIAAELKRVGKPLFGQADGPWSTLDNDGRQTLIEPSNSADVNYYWQAVHAANALQRWLWLNQRLFRLSDEAQPINYFGVWPDLVLLSDPEIVHRLPLSPANRFGQWWTGLERWVRHVETWRPRKGPSLCREEISRLATALNLYELHADDGGVDSDDDIMAMFRDLARRVERLERAS